MEVLSCQPILNTRGLRRGRRLGLAALALAGVTAGLAVATSGTASALPLCGGNQNIQMAPVTCTNSRTIDGTTFTVVLDVTAGGPSRPATRSTRRARWTRPIRVRSHRGISSNPHVHESSGVIPAGATSGVAVDDAQLRPDRREGGVHRQRRRPGADRRSVRDDGQRLPVGAHHDGPADDDGDHQPHDAGDHHAADRPDHDAIVGEPDLGGRVDDGRVQQLGALPTTGTGTGLLVVSALLVLVGIVLITKSRGGDAIPQ